MTKVVKDICIAVTAVIIGAVAGSIAINYQIIKERRDNASEE